MQSSTLWNSQYIKETLISLSSLLKLNLLRQKSEWEKSCSRSTNVKQSIDDLIVRNLNCISKFNLSRQRTNGWPTTILRTRDSQSIVFVGTRLFLIWPAISPALSYKVTSTICNLLIDKTNYTYCKLHTFHKVISTIYSLLIDKRNCVINLFFVTDKKKQQISSPRRD